MVALSTFDLGDGVFRSDPFPSWARLRDAGPLHRDVSGAWVVVRYREVDRLLHDERLGKDLRRLANYAEDRPDGPESAMERCVEQWIECRLPSVHRNWRRLVIPGFTAKAVERLRPTLERCAADLLATRPAGGSFELMGHFARPFPVVAIAQVLGLGSLGTENLALWSQAIGAQLEPNGDIAAQQAGEAALDDLTRRLWDEMEARRRHPRDDLLTGLVVGNSGFLTAGQLVATALLLFLSGNDTVASLIANGLLALSAAPEQAAALRAHPRLMPSAVEEMLRYDGPACIVPRAVYEPVTIDGTTIPPGSLVLLALGAANRDPTVFPEPDRFLAHRRPNRHLAFGAGDHHCVGVALARLETVTAIRALLDRFPGLTCDPSSVRWGDARYLRGPLEVMASDAPRVGGHR